MQISLNLNISPYNLINPLISISFFFSPKNFLKHTQYECFYFPMDLIQIWIYIKIPNIYFSSVLNKNNSHVKIIINISFYARLKIETENEMDQVRKKNAAWSHEIYSIRICCTVQIERASWRGTRVLQEA